MEVYLFIYFFDNNNGSLFVRYLNLHMTADNHLGWIWHLNDS
jgi:hypothetical protein